MSAFSTFVIVDSYLIKLQTKRCCMCKQTLPVKQFCSVYRKERKCYKLNSRCLDCDCYCSAVKTHKEVQISLKDYLRLRKLPCIYCHHPGGTVDRFNNLKGYQKHDCVPACYICNTAKSNMTPKEFLSFIRRFNPKWKFRCVDARMNLKPPAEEDISNLQILQYI